MGGAAEKCRPEPRGPIYIPADSLHNHKIMTTRIAGGLLLGYNPKVPGQGLKPLA